MEVIWCPWSKKEVQILKRKMSLDEITYKCDECGNDLIPTEFGFICEDCSFMQSWVNKNDLEV